MRSLLLYCMAWITGSILYAGAVGAVTPGQVDDFQEGAAGWTSGGANPNPPTWISDGGPLGPGDGFLGVEGSGVDGSGGNLIAFNTEQWSGDYTAAGVISIRADLRNLGESDLVIRLLVESPFGGFVSGAAASLPAGGAWRSAVIPLTATGVDVAAVLAQVTKLRILHAPTTGGAEPVVGVLGVDNLTALSGDLCLDAGLVRGDLAVCRVYCQQLDCPHGGPGRACEQLAVQFERRTGGVFPCELDADADGVEDAFDNCPDASNADQADLDGEGVGDACDNCPRDPNPAQEDSFGEPGVGDVCECPCFSDLDARSLVETLNDATTYGDLVCVDTRVLAKPLTFVRAVRTDGSSCAADTPECGAVAVEFTEDNVCQFNPPAPEAARVVQGISDRQRGACRDAIVTAAESQGLRCN